MRPRLSPSKLLLAMAAGGFSLAAVGVSVAQNQAAVSQPPAESAAAKIAAAKKASGYVGKAAKPDGIAGNEPAGPVGKTIVKPLADDGRGPDIAALRYYIAQGQKDRAEIEIKRLKTLYPNWSVPASVYDTKAAGAVDEQPLWDLYAAGEMDRLREEIAKRMREEPGWKPSDDLADKIRRKQLRNEITRLWKAGKWKDLLSFVKREGFTGDEADVDIMWTIAEAYAKTKQVDSALSIYKAILKSNNNPEQRLATVQKAMATLRMVDVEQLIALARKDGSGQSELAPIATDITRARISAFLHDERKEEVDAAEFDKFKEYARAAQDPNQPGLVAWYSYKRKDFSEALEWFKLSISKGGDTMIAHGLAHSLRELKLKRDTEEVAYAWREPLVNNAILFIDILERDLTKRIPPYIEPARLLRYAQVTMDVAAGEGAQGLAWYAYNTCQFKVALKWFRHAVAWHPKEGTVYGLAITLRRLKMHGEFWDLINRYDGLFPKVIELIYPDEYVHLPTPCDVNERRLQRLRAAFLRNGGRRPDRPAHYGSLLQGGSLGGYGAPPAPGAYPAQALPVPGQPPVPGAANGNPVWDLQRLTGRKRLPLRKNMREPNISRKLFPVSVDPQNPLRRWPVGRLTGSPAPAALVRHRHADPANEPELRMEHLVARRVPGVGPMPYERWGYALLPSYKGSRDASAPHQAVKAPKGTLWTTLHAKDALDTIEGGEDFFDPTTASGLRNLELAIAAIKRAPRVYAPEESRAGPWSAPKPYKTEKQLIAEKGITDNLAEVIDKKPEAAPVIRANLTAEAAARTGEAPAVAVSEAVQKQPESTPIPGASKVAADAVAAASRIATRLQSPPAQKKLQVVSERPANEAAGLRIETGATDELGRRATDLYNAKKYAQALAVLNQRTARLPETTKLRMLRAWALLNLRRVDEAREIFASLSSRGRPPAKSGKN
jgi:hypothetical protein